MDKILNNKKYLIFDNIFTDEEVNSIENQIFDPYFPWYLSRERDIQGNFYTVEKENLDLWKNNINVVDCGQFVHSFTYVENNKVFSNSINWNIPDKILKKFKEKIDIHNIDILRIKANLISESRKYSKDTYGIPHNDVDTEHYVLIYYVNNSDGDTVLFDENKNITDKISPKKGRILFFNGKTLHAGGHPVNFSHRCIINFDLKI
jgi:hypothetical protein